MLNSRVKLNVLTIAIRKWAIQINMIALVLTPAFKGTLADLLGWQYRIVITPTVIIVAVFHGTILGTQRIEFRPFTIAESALCSSGENRRKFGFSNSWCPKGFKCHGIILWFV